ncbi:hypothetical protein A6B43_07475 [Vespertiliibacter pulmonis]|uniref:Inner membrane protein YejM N-terminal domain-containing protein n=1 Tax=Vespertiliibacter pulmonis TaxID=1443036 RepID=A0A3N4VWI5_9PAST|nr:DUF3413 domain-containing protein [Vespertiliibacter pulmonis]QLB21372.1 hypothetical protein A6B43_07475 [Vespertiliibacter pulmonis]RPE85783.1 hypothetical protein EDC46_0163 [Vespertiliibacter pulmonis]
MLNQLLRLFPTNSRQYREETSQRIAWGHWFALFNILLALLITSRYALNADWPNTLAGKLYFFVSLFGHFSFVVFALYLLILFPLSFIIRNNRAFRGISVIFSTIGLTTLLVDTEVFKQFYLHLSPLVWDLLVNPDESELSHQWQLLFVPMPIILLAEMLYSRWCWNKLRSFNRQRWGKYVALFFLTCFTATHLLYAWADMMIYRPITAQKANYPLSYPMTARTFLEKHHLINRADLEQTIETSGRLDTFFLNYPKTSLKFDKTPHKTNLLFINLSGLSNEMINEKMMPTLYQVSKQSRYFKHHYTGGDTASAGISSLFYGLSGRYVDAILSEKKQSVLISRLQQLNYQFGLFSHNGFAKPIYQQALFANFKLPTAQDNQTTIQQWQQWLNDHSAEPFFSYLDLSLEQSPQSLDQQFDIIWQSLEHQGLTKNTLILITADIGQAVVSDNIFAMAKTNIPMILYWQQEQGIYTGLSSHLDITPTLLPQFFGLNSPVETYSQGINLTKENSRKWLLSSNYYWNVAILSNGEQYHIDRKGDFIHYNVENTREIHTRPPLALFLHLIQQSNQFIAN